MPKPTDPSRRYQCRDTQDCESSAAPYTHTHGHVIVRILGIMIPGTDAGHDVVEDVSHDRCASITLLDARGRRVGLWARGEEWIGDSVDEEQEHDGDSGEAPAVDSDVVAL